MTLLVCYYRFSTYIDVFIYFLTDIKGLMANSLLKKFYMLDGLRMIPFEYNKSYYNVISLSKQICMFSPTNRPIPQEYYSVISTRLSCK